MEATLLKLFSFHDKDKDGTLSPDELCSLLKEVSGTSTLTPESPRLSQIIQIVDSNHDGTVQLIELVKRASLNRLKAYLKAISKPGCAKAIEELSHIENLVLTDEEISKARELFRLADSDNDGSVSLGSCSKVIAQLGWIDPSSASELFEKIGKNPVDGICFIEILTGLSKVSKQPANKKNKETQPKNPLASTTVQIDDEGEEETEEEEEEEEEKEEEKQQIPQQQPPRPMLGNLNISQVNSSPSAPTAAFDTNSNSNPGGNVVRHRRANSRILSMTNRRNQVDVSQYLQRMSDIFGWISSVIGREIRDVSQLTDGVVLCELANTVKKGSVPTYSQRPAGLFNKLENVLAFTEATISFGLPLESVFIPSDLVQGTNLPKVFGTLDLFAKIVSKEPINFPIHYEPSITPGKFTHEQTVAAELVLKDSSTNETGNQETPTQIISAQKKEQMLLSEHKVQVKQYQERVTTLENDLRMAHETNENVKKRVGEYERMISSLSQEKETLHVQFNGLQAKLESVVSEHELCKVKQKELKIRAENAERKVSEEKQKSLTAGSNATAMSREEELLKRIAELERMLKELQEKYDNLLKEKAKTGGNEDEIEGLNADLEEERDKVAKQKVTIERLRNEVDNKNSYAETEAVRIQQLYESLQEKAKKDQASFEIQMTKERERHALEVRELQTKVEKLLNEGKEKRESSKINEASQALQRANKAIAEQKAEIDKLRLAASKEESKKSDKRKGCLTSEEQEKMNNELKTNAFLVQTMKIQMDKKEQKMIAMNQEMENLRAENNQLSTTITKMKREHEKELKEARNAAISKTKEKEQAQTPFISSVRPITVPGLEFGMNQENTTLETMQRRYESKIGALNQEIEELKAKLLDVSQQNRMLQTGRRPDMSETMKMTRETEKWSKMADKLGIENAQLKEKLAKAKSECSRLSHELAIAKREPQRSDYLTPRVHSNSHMSNAPSTTKPGK